jgi:hypothetical protein
MKKFTQTPLIYLMFSKNTPITLHWSAVESNSNTQTHGGGWGIGRKLHQR